MNRLRIPNQTRRGFSLLELTAAVAITGTLMVASMVVIRSSHNAWLAAEGDLDRAASAEAVVRHITRAVRQADAVVSITPESDTSGRLELLDDSGTLHYWEHTGTVDGWVDYDAAGARLARGINRLVFTGYLADGVTTTSVPGDVQVVEVTAQVTLPRGAGESRTISCRGWLRSW